MLSHRLMNGLSAQQLRFTVRALEPITLTEQPGSALRGALYKVLAQNFCSEPFERVTPEHQAGCPVCWLLAAEDAEGQRGQNISRPLTVEPPIGYNLYDEGQEFTFGYTLIGKAQNLFPYLARAVQKMGRSGLGPGRRRFKLLQIAEFSPLLDVERQLMDKHLVKDPTLHITPTRVADMVSQLSPERITLDFVTPLRLTSGQALVKKPLPVPFIQRLLERCQNLVDYYAEVEQRPSREEWMAASQHLSTVAQNIRIAYDDTKWTEVRSGSKRQDRYVPIGGLIGTVRWEGDLRELLPWLVWGSILHIGKNAVKGNGWYRIKR